MRKGVKILVKGNFNRKIFDSFLIEKATELGVTGSMQEFDNSKLIMYAVGDSERVESLIDHLYNEESNGAKIEDIEIKPMDETKDFRGIFRVINKQA